MTLQAPAATSVAGFLAATTNGPADTRFWGPVQTTVSRAREEAIAIAAGGAGCRALTDASAVVNRIALAAYLQGFLDLATSISERQQAALGTSRCDCARLSELQPWANLVRLARAEGGRPALDAAAEGLERALAVAAALEPSALPQDLAEGLGNGSVLGAADHVATIETAKLDWLEGDHGACERRLALIAPHSSGAMELTVRCLLATGRWAEAIGLAARHSERFAWLPAYAAAAFAAGGADDAASRVLGSLDDDTPLPLLRLCVELRAAGWEEEPEALARRVLDHALSSRNEVAALLASALLLEARPAAGAVGRDRGHRAHLLAPRCGRRPRGGGRRRVALRCDPGGTHRDGGVGRRRPGRAPGRRARCTPLSASRGNPKRLRERRQMRSARSGR